MLQPNVLLEAAASNVTEAEAAMAAAMASTSYDQIMQGGFKLLTLGLTGVFTVLALFIGMITVLVKVFPHKQ